jgi:hypothetical protein
MALLSPVKFEGIYLNPQTGESHLYAGTCVVAVDSQGRESMHVRGSIKRGSADVPLVALGHVDRQRSFVGREHDAVFEFVVAECQRHQRAVAQEALLAY